MKNLPCEIVQDLLPSYADGLTHPVTKQAVDAHLEGCASCRMSYERMTRGSAAALNPVEEKELNFLKKKREQTLWIVFGSLLSALFLLAAGLFVGFFVVSREVAPETLAYTIEEQDGVLHLHGYTVSSGMAITGVSQERDGQALHLSCKGTLVGVYRSGEFSAHIPHDPELREIWLGSRLIWADGVPIRQEISDLYNARHLYVGDMSANRQSADALRLQQRFGGYTNELQTETAPYGWTISFAEPIGTAQLGSARKTMRTDACLLMATIDNLDAVTFAFNSGGRSQTFTVTREEGDLLAGQPLRQCGENPALLQTLSNVLGRDEVYYTVPTDDGSEASVLFNLTFINDTELGLRDMGLAFYVNGQLKSSTAGCNADESLIGHGEALYFDIQRRDLGSAELPKDGSVSFVFCCTLEDGSSVELEAQPLDLQVRTQVFLLRQTEDGLSLVPVQ